MLLLALAMQLLAARAAGGAKQAVSVGFYWNGDPEVVHLSWQRPNGSLKEWAAMRRTNSDVRVSSFSGDVWVVTRPDGSRVR